MHPHRSYLGKASDPLCPLGFHPQVRFPTRCKRCYREFKDHTERRRQTDLSSLGNTSTASSPNLSVWGTSQSSDNRRSWSSSTNLAQERENKNNSVDFASPVSWPSSPDLAKLEDSSQPNIPTVSFTLPKRSSTLSRGHRTVSDSLTNNTKESSSRNDSLTSKATRLESSKEPSEERSKRIGHVKEIKTAADESTNDVQFLIQLKAKPPKVHFTSTITDGTESEDDTISNAGTETTDTTLVGDNEFQDQIEELKKEVESFKTKCDRLEREKSDLLLRRLASMETTTSKTTATEVLKLQQRCNELQSDLEDLRDDKKSLTLKVKELEEDLESRPTAQAAQKSGDELRSKLLAAETLCEELMDENEDIKKELRELEEEMEELHDSFREDQAKEYNTLKKELEQTTKNCRILAFKLRKKNEKEPNDDSSNTLDDKIKKIFGDLNYEDKILELEEDLRISNEIRMRLQKDLEEASNKLKNTDDKTSKKKTPMLGSITKHPSAEGKVSRESLTRGGSQEDPVQLMRDLQDSMEREADLREQLKFSEEEAQNLRKKVTRIEDDNESLVLQLKKMATKAKSRKLSPHRLSLEPVKEIDEGISEDPAELKILLELNDQEIIVLRKKIEELETERDSQKKKIKDLQEKSTIKTTKKSLRGSDTADPKIKALEDEANNLRKRLTQQEKENERLQSEINLTAKRAKGMQKSKSLDLDQNAIDLKRQLQVIEQEASVLRTKVQTLESENEKITAENKKLQLLRATRGAKGDKASEKFIDKIAELEIELEYANKKIKEIENKEQKEILNTKSKQNDSNDLQALKIQLSNVENERDKLADTIQRLKEDSAKLFRNRTPKKPSDFTSKIQLRNMVIDLENEIGEMLVTMNNFENIKSHLESQLKQVNVKSNDKELESTLNNLEEIKKKLEATEAKLQNETIKNEKEMQKYNELNNLITELNKNISQYKEENKVLENKVHKINEQYQVLTIEKEKIEADAQKYKSELKNLTIKEKELSTYKEKTKNTQSDLEKKEKLLIKAQSDLEEKEKLIKELNGKVKNLTELEKQLAEYKDKIKKTEKENKDQIKQLSNKLEKEQDKNRVKDSEQSNLSTKWSAEKKVLDLQIEELNSKIKSLEKIVTSKNTLIEQLEESVKKERESISTVKKDVSNKEINSLKDELNKNKAYLAEIESKLETTNKSKKVIEEKLKQIENDHKKEKSSLDKKIADLEIDLQNEKKKIDTMKTNHEKENKNRELELGVLKNKIKSLEVNSGTKKTIEIKQEYQQKIDKLESALEKEKREYESLTAKYEILEEEHVVIKAKLVMEKELLTSQLHTTKQELQSAEEELNTIKDTCNIENENIMKEKLKLQDQVKALEKSVQKGSDTFSFERERLKSSIEEKANELEQLKKEQDMIHEQMEYTRKENDELKKKLDDYSKLSKIQRNMSADTSAMDKEIRQLRSKLAEADRLRKSDVAECKMRYDSQMGVINNEINSLQGQVTRFKRERDTYKHMLEGAQKTIGDLKVNAPSHRESRSSVASFDEAEESRNKIATLEQQISCMEDELSESRLEGYKLKTELVSERSTWEIKLSEMQSRVNELEEERILSSGRTKIPGLRTRMELAWQKEREEQQRLLQETSTLARDLRQTLFEVEREKDKERLESKRKHEQLKKSLDEDQDENKRKISELQCDLLELRDAHAKLRTTNEKLRREREKHEKERDELRSIISGKRRAEQEDDRRMTAMLEQVDTLIRIAPELMGSVDLKNKDTYTPTPPRRMRGPKSRESSPGLERRDYSRESSIGPDNPRPQVQSVMSRLSEVTEEIRRYQKLNDESKERERVKKSIGMRRATSIEHDSGTDVNTTSKVKVRNGSSSASLHRRSLSLEHSIHQEQNIWRNNDSMSSLQSLDEESNSNRHNVRDSSFDSRLSSGSTQSETVGAEKKKKGLMSKLKKLTKSRSIDDQDPYNFSPPEALSKPASNSDISEEKGSKKDLRERITGIFKRGGSSSRSNSMERRIDKLDSSSTQRPLMPNGSNVLTRNSPGPEQTSKHLSKSSKHK